MQSKCPTATYKHVTALIAAYGVVFVGCTEAI